MALNWAIIGIAPFFIWAVYNFRKRRTASALIFVAGFGIIIFVMSREAKSQQTPTESVYYYHNDHLGTPKVITDQSRDVVWEPIYEPFGAINSYLPPTEIDSPFRFPGQYEDELTGLYYNHHRYYMPDIGIYQRSDPFPLLPDIIVPSYITCDAIYYKASSLSLAKYIYSMNNPILNMDIYGLKCCTIPCCQTHCEIYNDECMAKCATEKGSAQGACLDKCKKVKECCYGECANCEDENICGENKWTWCEKHWRYGK